MTMPTNQSSKVNQLAWLTLKLTKGVGNRSLLRLVSYFGSPAAALTAAPERLAKVPGLRPQAIRALQRKELGGNPETALQELSDQGVRLLCLDDPDYPLNLKAISDPPALLFVRGTLEPRDLVAVAVVGSRNASVLGMSFTERLCADLARHGVTIVSGMAVGIDTAAHQGALKAQGRTLAVLGCGLDVDYPRCNSKLREQVSDCGALLTEFPLGTPPEPGHFPARNRIISGLSLGVVVVEAAHRSGSLITARMALEQGREVFAVPGLARQVRSVGPHRLLRQGAKLVESAADILEEIGPLIQPSWKNSPARTAAPVHKGDDTGPCSSEEAVLLELLEQAPMHIDEIGRALEWPASRVSAMLLGLELRGAVQQLPGKYFLRTPA